jgi:hypothetical protein
MKKIREVIKSEKTKGFKLKFPEENSEKAKRMFKEIG